MTLEECVDLYCSAWSEVDTDKRTDIFNQVLTADATYIDPTVHARGIGELVQHIEAVLKDRVGSQVVRLSKVDVHHGLARFSWHMVKADGSALPAGVDFVEVEPESGKLMKIIGFFGPLKDR